MGKKIFCVLLAATILQPYLCAEEPISEKNAAEIKANDLDISVIKLKASVKEISDNIAEINRNFKAVSETVVLVNEKIILLEQDFEKISKNAEALKKRIVEIEKNSAEQKSDIENKIESLKIDIKANEQMSKVLLKDISILREDVVEGRKPTVTKWDNFKRKLPYISIGISSLALAIAVFK